MVLGIPKHINSIIQGGNDMSETKNKKKGLALAVFVLAAIAIIFGVVYINFSPKATKGAKELTIEVIDNNTASTVYTVHTDAEYLRQAIEETEGLTVEGTESEYGMMVETVNGITADYNVDGSYWAFFVDGDYCNYGIDTQPVEDGQAYQIVYTVAE